MRIIVLLLSIAYLALIDAKVAYFTYWNATAVSTNVYTGIITVDCPNGASTSLTIRITASRGVNFVQGVNGADKTDYFKSGSDKSPYESTAVDNDPPAANMISSAYGQMFTVEFSMPVIGIVMDFVSLNLNTLVFSNDFTNPSFGDGTTKACGFFGCGSAPTRKESTSTVGTPLYSFSGAGEPHGTLVFDGIFTRFIFSATVDENWYGFTFGTFGVATPASGYNLPIPVPSPAPRNVYYSNWNSATITENGVTKYTGTINIPRSGGVTAPVTVKLTVPGGVSFVQSGTGTDYLKSGSPMSPYRSSVVANDPPASSVVGLINAQIITLEFSEPVESLVLDFISINGNTLVFTNDFTLLSLGDRVISDCGYWGCSANPIRTVSDARGIRTYSFAASGEPHGALLFDGSFTKFTFATTLTENWHGFTIGTFGVSTVVPPALIPVYYFNYTGSSISADGVLRAAINDVPNPNTNTPSKVDVKITLPAGVNLVQTGKGGSNTEDYFKTNVAASPYTNSPYVGSTLLNNPPAAQLISIAKAQTITIEFSYAVTDIVLDFVSINGNSYIFTDPFTFVGLGNGVTSACGYWGCTTSTTQTVVTTGGATTYTLKGDGEPHGAILFKGTFFRFTFKVAIDEYWNGFTLGVLGSTFIAPPITCLQSQSSYVINGGTCSATGLTCVRLASAIPQKSQSVSGCYLFAYTSSQLTLDTPGQKVYLSSDAGATLAPSFDEVGVLAVTSPTKALRGGNYNSYQLDCSNGNFKKVTIPTSTTPGAVDITSLFGGEVGTFTIDLSLYNKYNPYSTSDAWVCTGANLKGATIAGAVEEQGTSSSQTVVSTGDGYSFNSVVLLIAGFSIASIVLTIAIFAIVISVKFSSKPLETP
eukprot:TRINITY_DN164_c0_g1_i5.p1 TRINITY_DN164_c0_g1~~TRINITY_DN164_c0_g1_i5.p1  ORF type:complete len:875 (-),score=254.63 TRINITY_DN164_c0_g1_i5:89-2713(-)